MPSRRAQLQVKLLAASVAVLVAACGNTAGGSPPPGTPGEVAAVVNGEAISTSDLEAALGHRLARLEEQAYELKKQQLDDMIAERLLAAEARRRGIDVEALLEQEVKAKAAPVEDRDIDTFVSANRSRLPAETAALRPRIQAYLAAQREAERRTEFVDALRAAAAVEVHLKRPETFRAQVRGDGPSRGPADAAVTVMEFSDFHCPFCRAVQPTLNAVLERYPNDVRLVYRHLPLDELHPAARRAAEASWCAAEQGKFWAFHDRVYAGGPDGSPATLRRLASEAGVDVGAYDACVASGRAKAPVQQDVEEATRHGITGTPGFLINGRLVSGNLPLNAFVEIIEEELGNKP